LGNKSYEIREEIKEKKGGQPTSMLLEKKKDKWKDIYGKEREKFYNRNGWGINSRELEDGNKGRLEEEIIRRERDGQRQWKDNRMKTARMKGTKSLIRGINVPII